MFGVFRYVIDVLHHEVHSVLARFSWPAYPGGQEWLRLCRASEKALVILLHAAVDHGLECGALVGVQAAREQIISWEDSAEISR